MPLPVDVSDGVRIVLEDYLAQVAEALPGSLEGVILFGSLVAGDFDAEASDLDLLVAVSEDVDDAALESLRRMHDRLARAHPGWRDRIDAVYVSTAALRTFQERESPIVVISAGEPLHRTRTDQGWIMNWHVAREVGVALLGPSPRESIAETTRSDFVSAVRMYMAWLLAKLERHDSPDLRAYAIVTACRALHACTTGEQASKPTATQWTSRRHPEWSATIGAARAWRRQPAGPPRGARAPIPRGLEFVRFVAGEVSRSPEPAA